MSEITPELVAAMASKIYNQSTALSEVQATGNAPQFPHSTPPHSMPPHSMHYATPSNLSTPASELPIESLGLDKISQVLQRAAQSVAGFPRHSALSTASTIQAPIEIPSTRLPDEVSMAKLASLSQGSEIATKAAATSSDNDSRIPGLQQFVQGVRGTGLSKDRLRFSELQQSQAGLRFGYEKAFQSIAESTAKTRAYDVQRIRRDFPILHQHVNGHPLIWFDNAATTQKPQSVIDAVNQFYAHDNSNIHRAAHTLAARSTDAFEVAREKVRRFLGAGSSREIVWVRGTTEGINLVAQTFGKKFLQAGDEILLSTLEHHANIVPWQLIARETGARIRVIPVNDAGEIMLSEYQMMLGPRTKLVGLTQASNSIGTILPVAEMTHLAHRFGARVLVDGAQSVAHFPVDVRQIDSDFFVFSGHKIFAPTGIGAVYIKEELLDLLPPWQGGGNMIRNVTFEETTFAEPPARFEAGTPSIADAVGLGAALDYVSSLGMENVARHEHELLHDATQQLSKLRGLNIVGSPRQKVSVISFVLPGHRTEEVGKALDQHGIAVRAGHHCAQPSLRRFGLDATVRPSFSIYNTHAEIDCLVQALRQILRQ